MAAQKVKDPEVTNRSFVNSEVGLKDCSLLAMDGRKPDDSACSGVDRNTVDQFLDEEPPQLTHN